MFRKFNQTEYNRNMNLILDNVDTQKGQLWLGDYYAALDIETLQRRGITTVLTTAQGLRLYYDPKRVKHRTWNIVDSETYNISRHFDDVIQEIESGLERGNVLVHCAAGISRSASCVIAYLMQKNQWNYSTAFSFVKRKRSIIFPNYGFQRQLRNLDKVIRRKTLKKIEQFNSEKEPEIQKEQVQQLDKQTLLKSKSLKSNVITPNNLLFNNKHRSVVKQKNQIENINEQLIQQNNKSNKQQKFDLVYFKSQLKKLQNMPVIKQPLKVNS